MHDDDLDDKSAKTKPISYWLRVITTVRVWEGLLFNPRYIYIYIYNYKENTQALIRATVNHSLM